MSTSPTYRLAPRRQTLQPTLDAAQQAVVDHEGGPLLVVAGPGTGKTTTLVEVVVERLTARGLAPEELLVLTFSRNAAHELRDRITARLGRATSVTLGTTFHSFAYGLVRTYSDPEAYAAPLRLLSAAEQDAVIRELLAGSGTAWPVSLAAAVRTRGFAAQVATLMARAQERGLGVRQLEELAAERGSAELAAAARFFSEYDDVLAAQNALDYAGLVGQAVALAQGEASAELAGRYRCIVVDEFQDTDPAQVALIRALAPAELIAVGDPHQAIYGFRGAQVRGLWDFPSTFATDAGPAPVVALGHTRRLSTRIAHVAARVAERLPAPPGLDAPTRAAFSAPHPGPEAPAGLVRVQTYDTERAEAEHIADLVRRAHFERSIPFGQMAVLVRSGTQDMARLRRALVAAEVPVEVSADETVLAHEPALAPLLAALHVATTPDWLDEVRARALLSGPLVGLDATQVRALAKALRRRESETAEGEPRSSGELLAAAVSGREPLDDLDGEFARRVQRFVALLDRARELVAGGGTAHEVLWTFWDGTSWPARLRSVALAGGRGARAAHRDLDAVAALMEAAAGLARREGAAGVAAFLASVESQELPAHSLAERGVRPDAVRLLTAHRSKGLEWDLVVVAGVNDEVWPDVRPRLTLLPSDELSREGWVPAPSLASLLAEERRLFYVALTRARRELYVTAVSSHEEDGPQPSRLLGELDVAVEHVAGRPERPHSMLGLVAQLRQTVGDPDCSDALRAAAARRLRVLADRGVKAADPRSWWGVTDRTASSCPVEGGIPTISASALTVLTLCPARWFFQTFSGVQPESTQAQGFGNVVHAIAEQIGRGAIGTSEEAIAEALAEVDHVWQRIPFRTPWSAEGERRALAEAVARFVSWHVRPGARELLGVEHRLTSEVVLPSGATVVLYGYADRLELDRDGRVVVIDLKTSKRVPTGKEAELHPQLGLYQWAVEHGAVDALLPEGATPALSGGAELLMVRSESRGSVKVVRQEPLDPEQPVIVAQLEEAASVLRDERWSTRPGSHCDHCTFARLCPAQSGEAVVS